jgi:hypothetical protein
LTIFWPFFDNFFCILMVVASCRNKYYGTNFISAVPISLLIAPGLWTIQFLFLTVLWLKKTLLCVFKVLWGCFLIATWTKLANISSLSSNKVVCSCFLIATQTKIANIYLLCGNTVLWRWFLIATQTSSGRFCNLVRVAILKQFKRSFLGGL